AFSDALKRAAVKFGIGRYLYRLPSQWVDYDAHKRQFVKPPTLPAFALPPKKAPAPAAKTPTAPAAAKPQAPAKTAAKLAGPALPANGEELQRRLYDYDSRLARQGLCQQGDLVKHVVQAGVQAGHDSDLATWSGPAIAIAVEQTKVFEAQLRQWPRETKKEVA